MTERVAKSTVRREQVREQRARIAGTMRKRVWSLVWSWPAISGTLFTASVAAIALLGESTLDYSIGQQVYQPIYARLAFQVPDHEKTKSDREAARAQVPSYYTRNASALTCDRIRADLMRIYEAAVNADSFATYESAVQQLGVPAEAAAYERMHALSGTEGRARVQRAIDALPLEQEYIVRDLLRSPRSPASVTDFVRLEAPEADGAIRVIEIRHADLVRQGNSRALEGSASSLARGFAIRELAGTVQAVIHKVFSEQPTILFNRERTTQAMEQAASTTPTARRAYVQGEVLVKPGVLESEEYDLLAREHAAYRDSLLLDTPEAQRARSQELRRRVGLAGLMTLLSVGLLTYVGRYHRRVFDVRTRTLAFMLLVLATLAAARLIDLRIPGIPELVIAPALFATSVLAITYPQRLAVGASCVMAVLVAAVTSASLVFLVMLLTGAVTVVFLLYEIRSRTKLISAGLITSTAVAVASLAGGFAEGHSEEFVLSHALYAGLSAMLASFVVSGLLPLIERLFRVATSLTLLEWRDPTRPLLQRLAREAPGTYNHSLALGTLAEAACEAIGANGLLSQVGALYHDIGKIPKADYFTENQEGKPSRHENLAPTMSLLIIVGHVKDGIEMAREYGLPRVLHQFIEEHHGTTVVRYFHHMASEKQPTIASGKHDREVREAEYRYGGPKPRTRESAVLMLCDGVEGAVRSLPERTPNRIEAVVDGIVADRLRDGQLDDCDITLREIRRVSESLTKTLCSIYHGRVAYPKARKADTDDAAEHAKGESSKRDRTSARAG